MHRIRLNAPLLLLTAALLLTGCSSVTTSHPIGEPIGPDSKLDLTGVWQLGDNAIYVMQLDDGKLRGALPKWKDDTFQLEKHELLLTEHEGAHYLHGIQPNDDEGRTRYTFSRLIAQGEDTLVLLPVNVAHFERAVASGDLAGAVDEGEHATTVHLSVSADAINAYITPDRAAEQFKLDNPLVLKRIGDLKRSDQ